MPGLQQSWRLHMKAHQEGIPRGMSLREGEIGSRTRSECLLSDTFVHGIDQRHEEATKSFFCYRRF